MADVQAETIKPDPSATSIANDEALNAKLSDNAAGLLTSTKPTDVEVGADEVQDAVKNTNPEADSSGESKDVSVKTNGHEIVEGSRGTTASAGSLARQEDTANGAGKYSSNSSKSKVETVKHSDHSSRSKSYSKESKSLRRDFSQNVKSDLTSQAESSDPVEIRKQVEQSSYKGLMWLMLISSRRLSSTSLILIFPWINFSSHESRATKTFQSRSKSFIPSNACVTFNHFLQLSKPSRRAVFSI